MERATGPSRRWWVAVAVVALLAVAWPWSRPEPGVGMLRPVEELPSDVVAEIDVVWPQFIEALGPRVDCLEPVGLLLVDEIPGGVARYVIADARIEIAIPTTHARFRESLVHELAHHVEHSCPAHDQLRAPLLATLGLPADSWSRPTPWTQAPSEIWAEAFVLVVLGERVRHELTMPLPPEAVPVVEDWLTP